jgi:hypothetical protein
MDDIYIIDNVDNKKNNNFQKLVNKLDGNYLETHENTFLKCIKCNNNILSETYFVYGEKNNHLCKNCIFQCQKCQHYYFEKDKYMHKIILPEKDKSRFIVVCNFCYVQKISEESETELKNEL